MSDSDECDECPVCGTPILAVEIRGPTEAERYASPCGHRLPADFDAENQSVGDGDVGVLNIVFELAQCTYLYYYSGLFNLCIVGLDTPRS
jgi:hypothetical protein